jgi:DNA-3-methyladenine glycosylase I
MLIRTLSGREKKAENFHRAYDGFQIATVAAYGEKERARLLADARITRSRRRHG